MEAKKIEAYVEKLRKEAAESGYTLTADSEMLWDLAEGLLTNEERYGSPFCPCRLIDGSPEENLDLICPCDYRDVDLAEYGACFCALYLTEEVLKEGGPKVQVPERRGKTSRPVPPEMVPASSEEMMPVWRCKVCGYLSANPYPPQRCPICKAQKERFEARGLLVGR